MFFILVLVCFPRHKKKMVDLFIAETEYIVVGS
jgi:hypothetical protein